jgi:NADH dehydrogenase [ubiquinone] 1 alpha subcomplex assembly factor 7
MQASNGSNISAEWYRTFESLPESDDISFSICNEFFDALPIHQFDFNENNRQWREVIVDTDPVDKEKLRFVTAPGDTPAAKALLPMFDNDDLDGKRRVEVSPSSLIHCQWLCERIIKQGGSSLIIDYGHEGQKDDTLRGFKNHKLVEILDNPGEIDITADVNFSHLRSVAEAVGVDASESISQDAFLKNMGIETR